MIYLAIFAGIAALQLDGVLAKCIGATCRENEANAKASGLLGAVANTCQGRDRSFGYQAEWKVRMSRNRGTGFRSEWAIPAFELPISGRIT